MRLAQYFSLASLVAFAATATAEDSDVHQLDAEQLRFGSEQGGSHPCRVFRALVSWRRSLTNLAARNLYHFVVKVWALQSPRTFITKRLPLH